jgi:uncharacterized damage-inducible protein DinB
MVHPASVVVANLRLLEQGRELIAALPDSAFARASERGKPVGPHFRHVFEHYSCFLDGLDAGRIDYDARAREGALETDRGAALGRIRELAAGLAAIDGADLDRPTLARLESGLGGEEEQWSRTTLRRELHFLLSHTVHHYALIGLLLAQRGIAVGSEFGVAPSTLKYWQSQTPCAPLPG